jgi:hypothetical protein
MQVAGFHSDVGLSAARMRREQKTRGILEIREKTMKTAMLNISWDKKIQIAILTVATFIALC